MVPTIQTGSLAKGLLKFTKVFAESSCFNQSGDDFCWDCMLYHLLDNYLIVGLGPVGLDIWDSLMKDMVP